MTARNDCSIQYNEQGYTFNALKSVKFVCTHKVINKEIYHKNFKIGNYANLT